MRISRARRPREKGLSAAQAGAEQGGKRIGVHEFSGFWFLVSDFSFVLSHVANQRPETRNQKPARALPLETLPLSPGGRRAAARLHGWCRASPARSA